MQRTKASKPCVNRSVRHSIPKKVRGRVQPARRVHLSAPRKSHPPSICITNLPKSVSSFSPSRHFSQFRHDLRQADANVGNFQTERSMHKTSLMFTVTNQPGALQDTLQLFTNHNINLTRLESKPCLSNTDYEIHVDFDGQSGESNVDALLESIHHHANQVIITQSKRVPWFPRFKRDLDVIASNVLDSGELEADHPGFHDPVYRQRRDQLAQLAKDYRYGQAIPRIQYTEEETATWRAVWTRLRPLHLKHGCAEFTRLIPLFEQNCNFSLDNIPQLQDINDYLEDATGFHIRPVAGLLSARDFLYGLALRTFFSTQYLRHHSRPFYTPEPDLCHEMCHSILFADKAFADFSQTIGLASLGATDDQIDQLSRVYWFTVEFGLCREGDDLKAFGAGILSSFGELEYSMGLDKDQKPELKRFDPFVAAQQTYPITTFQPLYMISDSFEYSKKQMVEFTNTLRRPFNVRYVELTQSIDIDTNVELEECQMLKTNVSPYAAEREQQQQQQQEGKKIEVVQQNNF